MSDKEKKKDKGGVMGFISQKLGVTPDEISNSVTLEMRGREFLLIAGCKRIEKYSPSLMVMRIGGDLLFIKGKRLICSSYHLGRVSVEGEIDSVGFEEDIKK